MARKLRPPAPSTLATLADDVLEPPDDSLLDVLDRLLNKGVMVNGDVTLGVAGVDLIYLRLGALLCASDRILPPASARTRASERRTPRKRNAR
jgi:gas vesicle structural protein